MPYVKRGGGNVMVWACLCVGILGNLYRVKEMKVIKEGYHSILQCHSFTL